jgi:hypothetical protein
VSSWLETASAHFTARHAEEDAGHAAGVLEQLETMRVRLEPLLPALPDEVGVVLHASEGQLAMARPGLPVRRQLTAPSARRYVAGALSGFDIHVLSPPLLEDRASGAEGSREVLLLTPSALYARLAVCAASPRLPPPTRVGTVVRAWRWAWLLEGIGAWLSGQTALARPAIRLRLADPTPPSFPPALRDAVLLGGTVVDLLAREEGEQAAVDLVLRLDPSGPTGALATAFPGRSLAHTEAAWRSHLARLTQAR